MGGGDKIASHRYKKKIELLLICMQVYIYEEKNYIYFISLHYALRNITKEKIKSNI